jgi:hypothetical protein
MNIIVIDVVAFKYIHIHFAERSTTQMRLISHPFNYLDSRERQYIHLIRLPQILLIFKFNWMSTERKTSTPFKVQISLWGLDWEIHWKCANSIYSIKSMLEKLCLMKDSIFIGVFFFIQIFSIHKFYEFFLIWHLVERMHIHNNYVK